MANLRELKAYLNENAVTFAAYVSRTTTEYRLIESDKKGIAPIMEKLDIRPSYFRDAYVADRVIGKAAAMLLVASGVRAIYADVMSEHAKKFIDTVMYDRTLGRNNAKIVEYEAKKVVPFIENRMHTGMCPMESAVLKLDDYNQAYKTLKEALENLQKNK